jgi:hypothetical protein
MTWEKKNMMLKSKRTLVGMTVAIILAIGYLIYATGGSAPAADDLKGWAILILVFIGISVIAQIITHIIVHVVFAASLAAKGNDERTIKRTIESEMAEDERDERITLRSSHIGYGCIGAGFIITLVALAFFDITAALMLNILLMVFLVSMMVDGAVSIYLYEKGDSGHRRRCGNGQRHCDNE